MRRYEKEENKTGTAGGGGGSPVFTRRENVCEPARGPLHTPSSLNCNQEPSSWRHSVRVSSLSLSLSLECFLLFLFFRDDDDDDEHPL